jgi:hypothetical protein
MGWDSNNATKKCFEGDTRASLENCWVDGQKCYICKGPLRFTEIAFTSLDKLTDEREMARQKYVSLCQTNQALGFASSLKHSFPTGKYTYRTLMYYVFIF